MPPNWKEKLRSLLDALETNHVETFMKEAKPMDYTRYGFAYRKATEERNMEDCIRLLLDCEPNCQDCDSNDPRHDLHCIYMEKVKHLRGKYKRRGE